jgi:hypothetical protein
VRRAAWLAGLLALAGAAHAADDAALVVVEACRARLDPAVDIGIERIARRCPDLLPAIEKAPWRDLMPRAMRERREDISASGLGALAKLVRESQARPALRAAPERAALDPILAGLALKAEEAPSRWEKFKRWLRERFKQGDDKNERGWLDELLLDLKTSEGFARTMTWLGYGLVIGLSVYVVWGEMRAAGLFGGGRRGGAGARDAAWRRRLTLRDINSAPLADRPGLMLRLLGEAFARAGRLPAPEGLTASAIAARAALESDAQRADLAALARCADRVRYAGDVPAERELADAVEAGRVLLASSTPAKGGH